MRNDQEKGPRNDQQKTKNIIRYRTTNKHLQQKANNKAKFRQYNTSYS